MINPQNKMAVIKRRAVDYFMGSQGTEQELIDLN